MASDIGIKSTSAGISTETRTSSLKKKDGTLVGGNYEIPKGDFGRFLGYESQQAQSQHPPSAGRTIEVALREAMQSIGEGATKNGMLDRNARISQQPFESQPGRTGDLIREGLDAVDASMGDRAPLQVRPGLIGGASSKQYMQTLNEYHAKSKNDNIRYLEMQYKFQYASQSFGTVSNLMKTRHEAVRKSISEVK